MCRVYIYVLEKFVLIDEFHTLIFLWRRLTDNNNNAMFEQSKSKICRQHMQYGEEGEREHVK